MWDILELKWLSWKKRESNGTWARLQRLLPWEGPATQIKIWEEEAGLSSIQDNAQEYNI